MTDNDDERYPVPTAEDLDRDADRGDQLYHERSDRELGQAGQAGPVESSDSEQPPAEPATVSITCRQCGRRMERTWKRLDDVPEKVDWKCECGELWQTTHYRSEVKYVRSERLTPQDQRRIR